MLEYRDRLFRIGALSLGGCLALVPAHAHAASGPVTSLTVHGLVPEVPQTAAEFAPSGPQLDQTEPTSTIGAETLRKLAVPTEDYNDVVRLTPSAMDISPIGPGLQQDFGQSIRGLQYTQFNVLYDGIQIPGFIANLAPQPGAYFMEHDLGGITVHRGPGQASTFGSATFGGFIALASPTLSDEYGVNPYGTLGGFGTKLFGLEAQSGKLDALGGGQGLIDLSREEARGATSGTATERRNAFLKLVQPIGRSTTATLVANVDNADTNTPYGATLDNIQHYGRNYALNGDPASQSFRGYNRDNYTTDFEYLGVRSDLGHGLTLEDKVYTASYYQRHSQGADPGGLAPNLAGTYYLRSTNAAGLTGDVPGLVGQNDFRAWGNVLRAAQDTPYGQARAGLWVEREGFTTYTVTADLTRGGIPYAPGPGVSSYLAHYHSALVTVQPYGEFAWKPLAAVTVTGGLKYSSATRSLNGPVGLIGQAQDQHATYNQLLPSLDANWRVADRVSVFAQAAKGYLTPNLNLFSTTAVTSITPSTTNSYQVGTVLQRDRLSLSVDAYTIQFNNYVNSRTVGGLTSYFNQGGAVFKGVELEGTVKLSHGFALYANGTLNDSRYDNNGNNLAQTPRRTGAVALIYDQGDLFRMGDDLHAILIAKNVGPQYGFDTANVGQFDGAPIKSYNQVDLDAGYVFPVGRRKLRFDVNVYDLFNDRSLIGYGGQTVGPPSQALYFTNPGRSIYFSLQALL
jgi:iron complex outermembrane receptor protein